MEKLKNFLFGVLAFLGGILLFLRFKNGDDSIKKQTIDSSKELSKKSQNLYNDAKTLDEKAKALDNVPIEEDEEWYKKH